MARIHTHYDNLKVARNAPQEVIRAAYKSLSQKYHPDRNGGSAAANRIIQIINASYEALSDPAKRREHDEWIARMEAEGGDPAENAAPRSQTADHPGNQSGYAPYTAWRHDDHAGRHSKRRHRRRLIRSSRYDIAMQAFGVLDKACIAFERICRYFLKKASRALPWKG